VTDNLAQLTKEALEPLTVTQIKRVRALIDEAIEKNNKEMIRLEAERDEVSLKTSIL